MDYKLKPRDFGPYCLFFTYAPRMRKNILKNPEYLELPVQDQTKLTVQVLKRMLALSPVTLGWLVVTALGANELIKGLEKLIQ
jgi:hypothetical protein